MRKTKGSEERDMRSAAAEYLTYIAATGDQPESVEMRYEDENIWLTQKMLAALYGVEVHTINEHISKVFVDAELTQQATIRNFRIVQAEGSRQVSREVKHYNLQMIIAEDMAMRHIPLTMQDWETRLNGFIQATDRAVLQDAGKVTAEIARVHAESEFEKYRIVQDRLFESDFDKQLKRIDQEIKKSGDADNG
ncbi:MAG: RhuM family protein [Chloroflexota bacterium]